MFYLSPPSVLDLFPRSRLIHLFCEVVTLEACNGGARPCWDRSVVGSSAGSAAAVLVNAFSTKNARMGERSSVPPRGGISPRNMFRYGSHMVLNQIIITLFNPQKWLYTIIICQNTFSLTIMKHVTVKCQRILIYPHPKNKMLNHIMVYVWCMSSPWFLYTKITKQSLHKFF